MEGGIVLKAGGRYRIASTSDYLLRFIVTGADGQAVRLDLEPDEAAVLAAEINTARQDVGEP